MMSVACSNSLKRSVKEFGLVDSGAILNATRDLIMESFSTGEAGIRDGMDISLFVLERQKKQLTWSGANNPLVILRDHKIQEYKADKQPVGPHVNQRPFTTHHIRLQEDDCVYLFSDGFQDQFGGSRQKKYSAKQLKQVLLNIHQHPMEQQRKFLEEEFKFWKGDADQIDDICVMGIKMSKASQYPGFS
jgi:serine phosphatase RsbU (regulator of sigma subunit)